MTVASHKDQFVGDITVIGHIICEDEGAYKKEVDTSDVVSEQQPHPQHRQNQGDGSGHEAEEEPSSATSHLGTGCGEGVSFKYLGAHSDKDFTW